MKKILGLLPVIVLCLPAAPLAAGESKNGGSETQCRLNFTLSSWSVFYKRGKGDGTITCDNGKRADVKISTHGGGVTFGKSKIVNGHGTFTKVGDISKLYGGYAETEAHAGASGSADARAMWNGDIGLALSGTGKGWNLGFNFGKFKIMPK